MGRCIKSALNLLPHTDIYVLPACRLRAYAGTVGRVKKRKTTSWLAPWLRCAGAPGPPQTPRCGVVSPLLKPACRQTGGRAFFLFFVFVLLKKIKNKQTKSFSPEFRGNPRRGKGSELFEGVSIYKIAKK